MFPELRLIVNFVGKSDYMRTDFHIFRDGLDIFTHCIRHISFVRTCTFQSKMRCSISLKMPSGWFYDVMKCSYIASEDFSDIASIDIYKLGQIILDFVKVFIITFHYVV